MKNITPRLIFNLRDLKSTALMQTKIFFYVGTVLALSACATSMTTTQARMDVVDLNYYQIDCNRKEEQLAFLRAHIPSRRERQVNGLSMTSIFGWANSMNNGTFSEDYAMFNGKQELAARVSIRQLETYCFDEVVPQKKQGCVSVNENTKAGASAGAQCRPAGSTKPITRWEAMVDN